MLCPMEPWRVVGCPSPRDECVDLLGRMEGTARQSSWGDTGHWGPGFW